MNLVINDLDILTLIIKSGFHTLERIRFIYDNGNISKEATFADERRVLYADNDIAEVDH
jgi:hypothetical protein